MCYILSGSCGNRPIKLRVIRKNPRTKMPGEAQKGPYISPQWIPTYRPPMDGWVGVCVGGWVGGDHQDGGPKQDQHRNDHHIW